LGRNPGDKDRVAHRSARELGRAKLSWSKALLADSECRSGFIRRASPWSMSIRTEDFPVSPDLYRLEGEDKLSARVWRNIYWAARDHRCGMD
jgi:hypothetical protein